MPLVQKFPGRAMASAHTARSMLGETVAMPSNCRGAARRQFPCHLHHQIPAHGISGKENLGKRIALDEFAQNRAVIPGKPGMVERRREAFGAAAIALIQAHRIPSGSECALRQPQHVAGLARTFQSVNQDERGAFPRRRLPVAFAEDSGAGLGFEFARRARGRRGNRRRQKVDANVCACGLRSSGCGSKVFIRTSFYVIPAGSTLHLKRSSQKQNPRQSSLPPRATRLISCGGAHKMNFHP